MYLLGKLYLLISFNHLVFYHPILSSTCSFIPLKLFLLLNSSLDYSQQSEHLSHVISFGLEDTSPSFSSLCMIHMPGLGSSHLLHFFSIIFNCMILFICIILLFIYVSFNMFTTATYFNLGWIKPTLSFFIISSPKKLNAIEIPTYFVSKGKWFILIVATRSIQKTTCKQKLNIAAIYILLALIFQKKRKQTNTEVKLLIRQGNECWSYMKIGYHEPLATSWNPHQNQFFRELLFWILSSYECITWEWFILGTCHW